MATKIVTKNSSTASAVPTASDLVQGELAVNVADKRLFTEDNAGAIVELGTNPSGNVTFQDNGKAIFGAGSDLQIYHDGSHSYIADVGAGDLILQAGNDLVLRQPDGSTEYLRANEGAGVQIYHNGSQKFLTTSTGIDVTGTATMDGLTVQTTNGLNALLESSNSYQYLQFKNTDETNNYIGFVSDDFVVSPANNQKLIVTAEGNVGIGTSSPSATLDIAGTSGSESFRIGSTVGGTDFGITVTENSGVLLNAAEGGTARNMQFATGGTERMRIDSAGNVLVGKTVNDLTTDGIVLRGSGELFVTRANDVAAFNRRSSDGNIVTFRRDGTSVGSIGTSTGGLYIADAGVGFRFDSGGTDDIIPCNATGGAADASINLGSSGARFNDLYLSESVKLSANDAGGVGSNSIDFAHTGHTAGPSAQIHVDYTGDFRANLLFKINKAQSNSAPTEVARFTNGGNLLVGTTSQGYGLFTSSRVTLGDGDAGDGFCVGGLTQNNSAYTVQANNNTGSRYFAYITNGSSAAVGSISFTSSATAYNTSSDQRLKDNIADADDAGSKVDAIQVRKFDWKADGSHQDYGMIAQELQTVAPEAVSGDADSEDMMGVDYSKLVPMLVKEIQSLRNRVAQLEE